MTEITNSSSTCPICSTSFKQPATGRKRVYCSEKCRRRTRKPTVIKIDPITGEAFVPKTGNQIYASIGTASKIWQKNRNAAVRSLSDEMTRELFQFIDTKAKRSIKKNALAATKLVFKWLDVISGKVESEIRNIYRSAATAPYLLNPQRGFRQLIELKPMAKTNVVDHLQTRRQFESARDKAVVKYQKYTKQIFHKGNVRFKTPAQILDDICRKVFNCGIMFFAKYGRGISKATNSRVNISDIELKVALNPSCADKRFENIDSETLQHRQSMASIPRSLMNMQKVIFGRAAA